MLSFVHPGEGAAPPRPETLVIGQEGFLPQARGCIWDCRREHEGVIEPLDVTRVPASDWDREWLEQQLRDYPCRETVSHICEGADLKADLPLSFCFTPHLFSIADRDAYASAYKDLLKLKQRGWYGWFTDMPFAPWGTSGQGTRPKPPDPLTGDPRHRRIVSGSDPYEPIAGGDGVIRPSVNAATKALYPPVVERDDGSTTVALPRISRPRRAAARRIDTIDAQPLARSGPLPQGEEAAILPRWATRIIPSWIMLRFASNRVTGELRWLGALATWSVVGNLTPTGPGS